MAVIIQSSLFYVYNVDTFLFYINVRINVLKETETILVGNLLNSGYPKLVINGTARVAIMVMLRIDTESKR